MKNLIFSVLILLSFKGNAKSIQFMTEDFPPFNYMQKGQLTGYAVDLLKSTFSEMNLKSNQTQIKVYPWARGYALAQKKSLQNALFSTTRKPARENLFKWFGPIAPITDVIFAKRGSSLIKDLKSIGNNRIAVHRSSNTVTNLIALGLKPSNLMEVNKSEQLIMLLNKKRVKYFAYEELVSRYKIKQLNYKNSDYDVVYRMKKQELWYAVNKSVANETVAKYQKALDKVKSNKVLIQKLKGKYFE